MRCVSRGRTAEKRHPGASRKSKGKPGKVPTGGPKLGGGERTGGTESKLVVAGENQDGKKDDDEKEENDPGLVRKAGVAPPENHGAYTTAVQCVTKR